MPNPWTQWWTDAVPLLHQSTFPRLLLALLLGVVVGAERQWRQRSAGMRTVTLVCFGAAAFVDLGATLAGPNTTGVIAYVVSGVGFLGAGAILKEGGGIRGLNTAATLWCAASVGACAGAGEMLDAVFVAVLLVAINLALRPISQFIDRRAMKSVDQNVTYSITATCAEAHESEVRARLLRAIAERPLMLKRLRTEDVGDGAQVSILAEVDSPVRESDVVSQIATMLREDPTVSGVEVLEGVSENE